jgi:hypothetical protein
MSNVFENVIAGIIVAGLLTVAGLLLTFGIKLYYKSKANLTLWLLERALKSNTKDRILEKRIVDIVRHESSIIGPDNRTLVLEYPNQDSCESCIQEAFNIAKKVKILTIRGQKYFLGSKSLLYDVCLTKREKGCSIEVLVLSPKSSHITNDLAEDLGHNSTERIRSKMRISLDNLRHISEQNPNFQAKCYDETPNFKMLLFDNVMFVSSFAGGGPKNDSNVKMLEMKREGNPLFIGIERYFDELSKRSVPLDN